MTREERRLPPGERGIPEAAQDWCAVKMREVGK